MVKSRANEHGAAGKVSLTPEQKAILKSKGDIRINAVAGSGKTTTVIEYARTRPAGSRILYLAFNRAVRQEAEQRFKAKGLTNVTVETAHSLAYKRVVFAHNYTVRPQGYKTYEIAALLGLKGNGEKHAEYIIAAHVSRFLSYFCNSDKAKVQDLNYLDTVTDQKAKAFVKTFYSYIERSTRELLAKMDRGEIDITHDFYLKKFQLQHPVLPYDYILFDEGQDASAAMLDVFLKQKATKVIVGDTHQQIYGWRYAVNSLEQVPFTTYHLSSSFRFTQDIADLAMAVLNWKSHLSDHKPVAIKGKGKGKAQGNKATIARTNLGLLLRAIAYITENPKVEHIYFEGNINSYTYADDGASLYDVLSLQNGRTSSVRDPLVQTMKDIEELEDYIEKTGDVQLGMMVEIVKEYGNQIPSLIQTLKSKHTGDEDRHKAEMVFSTVHRCKGMEYSSIELVADFATEGGLEKAKEIGKKEGDFNAARWNEEINLLYVALTRTRSYIRLPESLLPKDFPPSPLIQLVKTKKQEEKKDTSTTPSLTSSFGKSWSKAGTTNGKAPAKTFTELRRSFKEALKPWTRTCDEELLELFRQELSIYDIARQMERQPSAVQSRLRKLGMFHNED